MDVADEVCIGYLVICGDVRFFDKENGSGAFDLCSNGAMPSDAVGEQMAPFVGKAEFPDGGIGAKEELLEGSLFSSGWWIGG